MLPYKTILIDPHSSAFVFLNVFKTDRPPCVQFDRTYSQQCWTRLVHVIGH